MIPDTRQIQNLAFANTNSKNLEKVNLLEKYPRFSLPHPFVLQVDHTKVTLVPSRFCQFGYDH